MRYILAVLPLAFGAWNALANVASNSPAFPLGAYAPVILQSNQLGEIPIEFQRVIVGDLSRAFNEAGLRALGRNMYGASLSSHKRVNGPVTLAVETMRDLDMALESVVREMSEDPSRQALVDRVLANHGGARAVMGEIQFDLVWSKKARQVTGEFAAVPLSILMRAFFPENAWDPKNPRIQLIDRASGFRALDVRDLAAAGIGNAQELYDEGYLAYEELDAEQWGASWMPMHARLSVNVTLSRVNGSKRGRFGMDVSWDVTLKPDEVSANLAGQRGGTTELSQMRYLPRYDETARAQVRLAFHRAYLAGLSESEGRPTLKVTFGEARGLDAREVLACNEHCEWWQDRVPTVYGTSCDERVKKYAPGLGKGMPFRLLIPQVELDLYTLRVRPEKSHIVTMVPDEGTIWEAIWKRYSSTAGRIRWRTIDMARDQANPFNVYETLMRQELGSSVDTGVPSSMNELLKNQLEALDRDFMEFLGLRPVQR
jgi:hypothetical protein